MLWNQTSASRTPAGPAGPLVHPFWRHKARSAPRGLDWASFEQYQSQGIWGERSGQLPANNIYLGEGWDLGQSNEEQPYLRHHRAAMLDPGTRSMHMQVMGNTGSGKSHFLRHMIQQDIIAGHGVCVIDPHGELVEDLLRFCIHRGEKDREVVKRLHVMRTAEFPEYVLGYNPLQAPRGGSHYVATTMADACLMAWNITDPTQTPRLSRLLQTAFESVIIRAENNATDARMGEALALLDLEPKHPFRQEMMRELEDYPDIRKEWEFLDRLSKTSDIMNQVESTYGRLSRFLRNPFIHATFHAEKSIDVRKIMADGHILLCDLSPGGGNSSGQSHGVLPEQDAVLLAGFLQGHLYHAAMQRPRRAKPFYIYVDEFGSFLSKAVVKGLPQVRKKSVGYILSHQYLYQLEEKSKDVLEAVTNATRTKVVFGGLRNSDRETMAQEMFSAYFDPKLIKHEQYVPAQYEAESPERLQVQGGGSSHVLNEGQARALSSSESEGYNSARSTTSGESLGPKKMLSIEDFNGNYDKWERWWNTNQGRHDEPTRSTNESFNDGHSQQYVRGTTDTTNTSVAKGTNSSWTETLHFPKYVKEHVSSVQFFSLEEQLSMAKSMYAKLDLGEALISLAGSGIPPFLLSVPPIQIPMLDNDADTNDEIWDGLIEKFFRVLHKNQPTLQRQAGRRAWLSYNTYQQAVPTTAPASPQKAAQTFFQAAGKPLRFNEGNDDYYDDVTLPEADSRPSLEGEAPKRKPGRPRKI